MTGCITILKKKVTANTQMKALYVPWGALGREGLSSPEAPRLARWAFLHSLEFSESPWGEFLLRLCDPGCWIPIFLLSDASSILSQEIEGKGCCSPTIPHIPTYKNAHATQSLGAVQGVFLCHGGILTWASVWGTRKSSPGSFLGLHLTLGSLCRQWALRTVAIQELGYVQF